MVALPALWVGLTYDQGALDAAADLVKGWSQEIREGLRRAASVSGLQGEAGGVRLQELAGQVLEISAAGLAARGLGEEALLDPFRESVASGKVPADRLLDAFHGEWQGDITRVYEATRL